MTTVFLSYRHENDAHSLRVRNLALGLRAAGVTVVLDALKNEEEWNKGGPDDGWLNWSYAQVAANNKVLIIATPSYSLVYENKAPVGVGVGAAIEARRIFQQIADTKGINKRFRVVILHPGDEVGLPDQIKDYHQYKPNERPGDLADLITWLTAVAPATVPALVSVPAAPTPTYPILDVTIDHGTFVNCTDAFAAFEEILTLDAPHRILLVHGHGKQGKSTLFATLYHHCRSLLGAKSTARVEFKKGGASPEEHLRAIARALGLAAPTVGNIDERVHALLDLCTKRPAVIFFDAYEHADQQHTHWVNLILERTVDDTLLRCAVAGRELPPAASQPWGKYAITTECDALKDKDALVAHAKATGYTGNPDDIIVMAATFCRLRDRAIAAGQQDHSISSQAFFEEIQSFCKTGGRIV